MGELDSRVEEAFNSLRRLDYESAASQAHRLTDSSLRDYWNAPLGKRDAHKIAYIAARPIEGVARAGLKDHKAAGQIADAELARAPYRAQFRRLDMNIIPLIHVAVATISAYEQKRPAHTKNPTMEMLDAANKKFGYCVDRVVELALRTEAADLKARLRPNIYTTQQKEGRKAAIKAALFEDMTVYLGLPALSVSEIQDTPITKVVEQLNKNSSCLNPSYVSAAVYKTPKLPVLEAIGTGFRNLVLARA